MEIAEECLPFKTITAGRTQNQSLPLGDTRMQWARRGVLSRFWACNRKALGIARMDVCIKAIPHILNADCIGIESDIARPKRDRRGGQKVHTSRPVTFSPPK